MKSVVTSYQVLEPSFLSNASHLDLKARFHYERGKKHSLFVLLIFFALASILTARFNRTSIKETKNALFHARSGNEPLRLKQESFLANFLITSLRCFLAKCSPSKRRLEKRLQLKSAKKMASFLIVKNVSLATTYPDVCTAYMMYMYMTVPVTVATAERCFSKFKLFKNFLQSPMSQERLSGLDLLSIENKRAKNLDFRNYSAVC